MEEQKENVTEIKVYNIQHCDSGWNIYIVDLTKT